MGFAAGLSAGVAAGKAGRATWEERETKKRDEQIAKSLSDLDADQANREAADTEAGDFDEESGYDRNMEGLTAFTPSEMASKRGGLYTGAGDLEGGQRYEDQATAFRRHSLILLMLTLWKQIELLTSDWGLILLPQTQQIKFGSSSLRKAKQK